MLFKDSYLNKLKRDKQNSNITKYITVLFLQWKLKKYHHIYKLLIINAQKTIMNKKL